MNSCGADGKNESGGGSASAVESPRRRPLNLAPKRVNVDFPTWMVESLDREANRLGVPRQSIIKVWIAEMLAAKAV